MSEVSINVPAHVLEFVLHSLARDWQQHKNGGGWIYKTAKVDESVYIHLTCIVYGSARVLGDDWTVSPMYIQGTKHSITLCSYTKIAIGCYTYEITYWLDHYKEIGCSAGYTSLDISEYGNYLRLIAGFARNRFKSA